MDMKNYLKSEVYNYGVIILREFHKVESFFLLSSSQGITSCFRSVLGTRKYTWAIKLSATSILYVLKNYTLIILWSFK